MDIIQSCAEHPLLTVGLTAVALGAATMVFGKEPEPIEGPISLDQQSIELPGPEHIHVSPLCDYKNGQLVIEDGFQPEVSTCYEAFLHGMKESDDGDCLGWRNDSTDPFQWMSYSQVRNTALQLGSALVQKGLTPGNETNVGVYSQNRPEWVIMDLACMSFSMVAVALYDTLGVEACHHIINITEMETIFIDKAEKLTKLEQILGSDSIRVKLVILFDGPLAEDMKQEYEKMGIEIILYKDLLEIGTNNLREPVLPKKDDRISICFTSGTTGVPKGAIMTHDNFLTDIRGLQLQTDKMWMTKDETHLSYLPLAHQYERLITYIILNSGSRIGFFQGDIKKLLDDIKALRPTVFPSVPRLLNRIYDKIMSGVSGANVIKKSLFNLAYSRKAAELKRGIVRNDSLWDKLVFRKVQDLLGGRVRWIITGSAPLSTEVITFLRIAFGCVVSEGYGQTECTACATITSMSDVSTGHVGAPIPSCMIKLVDVPDKNYFAADDKGEICFKGPILFKGYLNEEEKTRDAIDEDGWLHSGDIGQWNANGTLKIIDRKKHIFKLSQGEYVAPERLESIYTQLPLVAQAFIYGEGLKDSLVGIIVPDEEELPKYAAKNKLSGSYKELCEMKEVNAAILEQIKEYSRKNGLKGFEVVRAIFLHSELFSSENNLLTPTFKNKRAALTAHFQDKIQEMYDSI